MTADLAPLVDISRIVDPAQRAAAMRKVEALMSESRIGPGDERLDAFDAVLLALADAVDVAERAALAGRLSAGSVVPPRLLARLACDEDIAVAGPLLAGSPALDDETLLAVAMQRGDDHLVRIAARPAVGEPVTDVIVERAGPAVLVVAAGNPGARFSGYGFARLAARASENPDLSVAAARRADLPRRLLGRVIGAAPPAVLERLVALGVPGVAVEALRGGRIDYAGPRQAVSRLARAGALDESAVAGFAEAGSLVHVIAALAEMSGMSIAKAEGLFLAGRPEGLLLVARALGFSWPAAQAMVVLRAAEDDPVALRGAWERLGPDTARAALIVRTRGSRA